jgi:hypothetical protein
MFAALIQYRWLIMGAGVFILIGSAWVHGYIKGSAHERAKIITQTVKVMEKRNEIASKRPDKFGVIKRLRDGSF